MPDRTALLMEPFAAVCADYYAAARRAAAGGRPVAGFFCSYSPQEIFHAAGYLPVRVFGHCGETGRADEVLQPYACSFARSALHASRSGEFDFLSVAVFAHTCDTMQNVADLWHGPVPVMITSLPSLLEGAAARRYFRADLERIRGMVEQLAGPVSDAALLASVRLHLAHQAAMRRLYALRRMNPGLLSGADAFRVVLSSMLMDKADHLPLLEPLLDTLAQEAEAPYAAGLPRILVAGSMCQQCDFADAIERAGCVIVDDDLCVGSRSFELPDADGDDPLDLIMENYLSRRPCPAFHKPGHDPGPQLVEMARNTNADGVVFLMTSFCDPMAFDHPRADKCLADAGIPSVTVFVEQHQAPPEQLTTRVQAFLETLGGGTRA